MNNLRALIAAWLDDFLHVESALSHPKDWILLYIITYLLPVSMNSY